MIITIKINGKPLEGSKFSPLYEYINGSNKVDFSKIFQVRARNIPYDLSNSKILSKKWEIVAILHNKILALLALEIFSKDLPMGEFILIDSFGEIIETKNIKDYGVFRIGAFGK